MHCKIEPIIEKIVLRPVAPVRDHRRQARKKLKAEATDIFTRSLGITEAASVQKRTIEGYTLAVTAFERIMRLTVVSLPVATLDSKMVTYFDYLYLEGECPSVGERLWAAVRMLIPEYSSHGRLSLPRAWRSLKGWRRLVPQKTRRPLPWVVVAAIAHWLACHAGLGSALAWLTMVDAYLRPGECMRLVTSQVLPRTSQKWMDSVVLLLHPDERGIASNTGEMNESLAIRRPWLADLLNRWARSRRSPAMWDCGLPELRANFLKAATMLELTPWRPVLYMGRHSGASLDRLEEVLSLAEVQRRGRWRSEASVRRYEKRALVQEVYLKLPLHVRKYAHRCEKDLVPLLLRLAESQLQCR